MRAKAYLLLRVLVSLLPVAFNSVAESSGPPSKEEILALLPRGIDMDDDNDIARYNRLIALGPAVHAVLGEELLRVDDFEPASRIIGIFEESRGDKSVAIKYLERFLDLPRTGSEWRDVKAQGSKAINKLRGEQSLLDAHGTVSHAAIPQDSAPTRKLELNPADANSPPTPMALPVSTKVPSETIAAVIEQTPYLWIWVGVTVALVVIVTIAIKRSA